MDYQDFLRKHELALWDKNDERALKIRKIGLQNNRSYMSYKKYIQHHSNEIAANTLICLINQTNYLLEQLLRRLEKDFLEEGGFTEKLYWVRRNYRNRDKK